MAWTLFFHLEDVSFSYDAKYIEAKVAGSFALFIMQKVWTDHISKSMYNYWMELKYVDIMARQYALF